MFSKTLSLILLLFNLVLFLSCGSETSPVGNDNNNPPNTTTYTVTYLGNGNTGGTVPSAQTKTAGVALTLSSNTGNLVKSGFTFVGWNTAANGSGTDYAVGASYAADANVTLYAKWTSLSPSAGMVQITGGTFQMGSTTGDAEEAPVHTVTVSDFWLDTTEVTQKQYGDLMSSTYIGFTAPSWSSSYGLGDNNPAYYVNWYDAVLYCNARTKASGSSDTVYSYTSISGTPGNDCELSGLSIDLSKQGYRLPTEAEWEYACRGGTTTDYYWGSNSAGDYAWYLSNSGSSTHPVAQKLPNAYGLYDMSGNVWEWCNDWYGSYDSGSATNPTGPSSGSYRVRRGGSWHINASFLRSAFRFYYRPDIEYSYFGFRVVLPAQ